MVSLENDFSTIQRFTSKFIYNLKNVSKIESNEDLFPYYLYVLRSRHDYCHLVICLNLFDKWVEERRVDEIYPDFISKNGHKTPDIVYENGNKVYLIDVSITSRDLQSKFNDKMDKYFDLARELSNFLKKEVYVLPIVILKNGSNLDQSFTSLYTHFKIAIEVEMIYSFLNLCEESIRKITLKMDKKYLVSQLKKEFNLNVEFKYTTKSKINIEKMEKICDEKYPFPLNVCEDESDIIKNVKLSHNENIKKGYFKDDILTGKMYDDAFEKIKEENSKYDVKIGPTTPFLFPLEEDILPFIKGENSEQLMTINFLKFFLEKIQTKTDPFINFLNVLFRKTIEMLEIGPDSSFNKKVFFEGMGYDHLKKIYHDKYDFTGKRNEGSKSKKTEKAQTVKNKSFRSFLADQGVISHNMEKGTYAKRQKTIVYDVDIKQNDIRDVWKKSGVSYYKYVDLKDVTRSKKKTTPLNNYDIIDKKIKFLNTSFNTEYNMFNELKTFLYTSEHMIGDSDRMNSLRQEYVSEYREICDEFLSKNYSKYLWFHHLAYSQLMHILSFTSKNNEITFFNTGIPNFLCLVTGGYKSNDEKTGKAFLSCVFTRNPSFYDDFFGGLIKTKISDDLWFIMTGWRRCSMDRCTFIRDSFYSVFSSSINLFFDMKKENKNYFHEMCSIKSIISTCAVQQIQEFLMDNRYAYMSAFSVYTNIQTLLTEKFAPPYKNCLSVWIIKRLFTRLNLITKKIQSVEGAEINIPIYNHDNIRLEHTFGGSIYLPSLFTDYYQENIEQVLEEAFIYVHTMKEPANLFHEKVKAINTIKKYQNIFDDPKNPQKFLRGSFSSIDDFNDFSDYCQEKEIGFCSSVIYHSFKHLLEIIKPNYDKIVHDTLTESVGEIASTKAVIHTLDREIEEIKSEKHKIKILKKFMKKFKLMGIEDEESQAINEIRIYKKKNKSKLYSSDSKERQKVWETIIEKMERNENIVTVEDLCKDFIENEGAEVEADICIKSQYGSKREFYVVNIGAKALARIVEKFFQKLAETCNTECISIPGDKKMMNMQHNLDEATKYAYKNGLGMRYVNGDCTKWSAAETLGSFLSIVESIKPFVDYSFYLILKTCFSTWANKKINIPFEIYTKVIPRTEETTYLISHEENKKFIKSTQNFLQGMFNYASSLKASACNYYTTKIWDSLHPKSKLRSFHLEHSDDYVQVIVYETEDEFMEFRQLYKYMMRLHGYNDSKRKTSCQQLFMEFVSLMSFNGKMMYPRIKKAKEINLNLPCTGYKADMEAALSRQGECLRMGCNQSFCYFFSRLHVFCVLEAYAMVKGMKNHNGYNYDYPIEIFGIPDQLPLFSLYCKGNINNYRILNYTSNGPVILSKLVELAKKRKNNNENDWEVDPRNDSYDNFLESPFFKTGENNNMVKILRKNLGVTKEMSENFWKDNLTYRFIKPKDRNKLLDWMKLMFLNRGFLEAYSKMSRSRMTLRLSRFNSTKCIKIRTIDVDNETQHIEKIPLSSTIDIREYVEMIKETPFVGIIDKKKLTKISLRSDPTATAIYSIITNMNILKLDKEIDIFKPTTPCFTPKKIGWFFVENQAQIILQKIYNPGNFILDSRVPISEISLQKDIDTIKKNFNITSNPTIFEVQSLYNDIVTSKYIPIMYMGFSYNKHTLLDAIIDQIRYNLSKKYTYSCQTIGVNVVLNPYNGLPYFIGSKIPTENTSQQCLENICLIYTYLKIRHDYNRKRIIKFLENLIFLHISTEQGNVIETKKELSYIDVLEIFSPNSVEISQMPTYIKKIAAYLRFVLLTKDDLLNDLINNVYSYTHHYISTAIKQENRYIGETVCKFTYLNNTFEFVQIDNNIPYMYTSTKSIPLNKAAYMIALKLSNILKDYELQDNLVNPDIEKYLQISGHPETSRSFHAVLSKNTETNKQYFNYREIENWYPIFLVKDKFRRNISDKRMNISELYKPILFKNVDEKKLLIKINKEKLYTLPFWLCKQYPNMLVKKEKIFSNLPLKNWFDYRLFQRITKGERVYGDYLSGYIIDDVTQKELEKLYFDIRNKRNYIETDKKEKTNVEVKEFTFENFNQLNLSMYDPSKHEETKSLIGLNMDTFSFEIVNKDEELLGEDEDPFIMMDDEYDITNVSKMSIGLGINFKEIQLINQPNRYKLENNNENFYLKNIKNHFSLAYLFFKHNVFKQDTFTYDSNDVYKTMLMLDDEIKKMKLDTISKCTRLALLIYLNEDTCTTLDISSENETIVKFKPTTVDFYSKYKAKNVSENIRKIKDKGYDIIPTDKDVIYFMIPSTYDLWLKEEYKGVPLHTIFEKKKYYYHSFNKDIKNKSIKSFLTNLLN